MAIFNALLALMIVLLVLAAVGRLLLQLIDCLLPRAAPAAPETLSLQVHISWQPVTPAQSVSPVSPVGGPYPPGRRIG